MKLAVQVQSAITMLEVFFESSAPFDIVMSKYFKNNKWIGSHDRREIAEFCYLIFRNYEKLRFLIDQFLDSISEQSNALTSKNLSRFMALGCLQLLKKFRVEALEEIFDGNLSCPPKLSNTEEAFLQKLLSKNVEFPEHAELNYPLWMESYFKRSFEDENFIAEMTALNSKPFVNLRVNVLKTSKEKLLKNVTNLSLAPTKFSQNGLKILEGRVSRNHPIIKDGLAEIQDEGSQIIAEICCKLPQKVGLRTVVDFCAGAGGKTLAIAAFMKNKGRIFALDKYPERLENAKMRFRRAGVNNVTCQEICGKWLKRHKNCGDIVLVDAPCSGTGTWRRNPDMRAKFRSKDLKELLSIQAQILEIAVPLVKHEGYLVYSTCSVLLEENDDQVALFLEKYPNFRVKKIDSLLSKDLLDENFLRLSPFRNDTDGFFAAVLERFQ